MRPDPPFSVLGIAPDADEKAIKRAYVALVRQHRPDKDPVMFARIHAAYEAALALQKEHDPEAMLLTSHEYSPPVGPVDSNRAPEDLGPAEAARSADGEEAAPSESFATGELEAVNFAPPMTLEELVARVGPERAALLVDEATDELLVAGSVDYLAHELLSEAAERLLTAGHDIRRPLLKTSAALAYSAPARAHALQDRVELGGGDFGWLDDRALLAHSFSGAFDKASGQELPPELSRLVALLPLVGDRWVAQLLESALSFARAETRTFTVAMDRLPGDLLGSIGRYALDDADDGYPDPEPNVSERALQDLWRDLEQRLEADPLNFSSKFLPLLVGSALLFWYWFGWLGAVVALFLVMAAAVVFVMLTDVHLYARQVRQPLLALTLKTGVAPADLAASLKLWPWASEIGRFTDEIRDDALLLLTHRLVVGAARLRRRFEEDDS